MKTLSSISRSLVVALVLTGCSSVRAAGKPVELFAGGALDAWQMDKEGGWKVTDGVLAPDKGGYLWSKESFGDFELMVEFKMSEKCNSGVFFRTDPKNPVQGGFEIQVFDSHGKADVGKHDCGALYDAVPPKVNAAKPAGEWNSMVIRCQGPSVSVTLNGQKVVEANLDEWTTGNQNPDGSKNKFKTALKDLPRTGKIGLQYHGHPVWFRGVKLHPLN